MCVSLQHHLYFILLYGMVWYGIGLDWILVWYSPILSYVPSHSHCAIIISKCDANSNLTVLYNQNAKSQKII